MIHIYFIPFPKKIIINKIKVVKLCIVLRFHKKKCIVLGFIRLGYLIKFKFIVHSKKKKNSLLY